MVDDGSSDFALWALGFPDALAGKFTDADRRARSSSRILSALSPDGGRILIARDVASSTGQAGRRYTIQPFAGGAEAPLNVPAGTRYSKWIDSVTVEFGNQVEGGIRVNLMDVRTGAISRTVDLPDSLVRDVVPLADGWAWVPASSDRIVVRRGDKTTEIAKPAWFNSVYMLDVDVTGQRLLMVGWGASQDTLGVAVVPVDGGTPVMWARAFAERGPARFLADGSILFQPWDTPESIVFYKVTAPEKMQRLGKVPRSVAGVNVSDDLKRAMVLEADYHGDAFMSRVVRP